MDESLTDNGVDQNSGADQSALPEQSTNTSADEQHQDTVSSGEQSQDSGQGSQDEHDESRSTQKSGSSDDDEALARFAKSQGIEDIEDLSDREKRLLKVARDNQVNSRKKLEKENEGKVLETVEKLHSSEQASEDDDEVTALLKAQDQQIRLINARQRSQDFFSKVPEAREYEAEMAQVLVNEKEKYGEAAAVILAQNLDRVFREAKDLRGDNDVDSAREAGRRAEREELRRKQEASSESASATDHSKGKTPKVTRDWIANHYDPSNEEHRKMVDEAMAKGAIS